MTSRIEEKLEEKLLRGAIARLRASVMAVVFGLTGGTGLFVATVWLLIRGGENVGQQVGPERRSDAQAIGSRRTKREGLGLITQALLLLE